MRRKVLSLTGCYHIVFALANNGESKCMVMKVLYCGLALLVTVSLCGSNASADDTENVLVEQIRAALAGNDLKLALSEAQEAVPQHPNSAPLYQMLGSVQLENGAKEDARAAFQRAIDL